MKWLAFTSIKKKLLMIYLPLIIIPTIIILLIAYHLFSYEMDQASYSHAEETVEVINRHLETYLDELERLTLFPYFENDVMSILQKSEQPTSQEEKYQEYKFFEGMFNNIMLNPREDLLNVSLYQEDGRNYFNTRVYVNLNPEYQWKNTDWYRRTLKANGEVIYTINSEKDERFTTLNHDIFFISRLIKSENGTNLGAILIDANFQGVSEVLRAAGLGDNSNVILRDRNGNIIFSQNELYLDAVNSPNQAISGKLNIDGETLFMESRISDKTGWEIVGIIPSGEISESFVAIRRIILLMLVMFGMITVFVTIWFSESLTRPIRELHQRMQMVEGGNYDVSIDVKSQDELGSLGNTFNKMSAQIKGLIHEVYEYNLQQKEAELNNLKMQIRPHFLYNTLEAIRSLADISDNREVVEMTTSLGSILRYSIKTPQKFVPLAKELDYSQQYLTIQQIMVGDAIRVEYDIVPDILHYLSIPFLFQPIIENAFQHGLYGKRKDGIIRISGKREEDELQFAISDNGAGISSGRKDQINRMLRFPDEEVGGSPAGIGLSNVNKRIKIVFGEAYGLFLDDNPEGGVTVHIKIPIVE